MAKANVLARRIRAYERRVVEIEARHGRGLHPRHERALEEAERLEKMWAETTAELESWMASRIKGPWAKQAAGRV